MKTHAFAVALAALLFAGSAFAADPAEADVFARVIVAETDLRAGPGISHRVIHRAKRGDAFLVETRETSGYWLEVLLPDAVRAKVERLLATRKRAGETITPTTPVFVSRLGRRLSARQLREAFAVWQERAGFERHVGFHTLRHHACSAVYRASRDLRLTQKFARHKSVVTTSIYTHPTDDELLRAVQGLVC